MTRLYIYIVWKFLGQTAFENITRHNVYINYKTLYRPLLLINITLLTYCSVYTIYYIQLHHMYTYETLYMFKKKDAYEFFKAT